MSPGGQTAPSAGVPMQCADDDKQLPGRDAICRDFLRGACTRPNCRFLHEITRKCLLKETFNFCHDYQNKGCFRINCKFIHCTIDEEEHFYNTGFLPQHVHQGGAICKDFLLGECRRNDCKFQHNYEHENEEIQPLPPPPQGPLRHSHVRYEPYHTQPNRGQPAQALPPPSAIPHAPYFRELLEEDAPSEAKFGRYSLHEENNVPPTIFSIERCRNCDNLDRTVSLLHDNMNVLLKKVADLTQKNMQLSAMNEFLLDQTASLRGFTRDASCVMTSSVATGTSAPVSLTTVSVSPVVPALVPAAAAPSLLTPAAALSVATSRSQLLGTTQQLVSGSGALIVTSAGAQQLVATGSPGIVAMTAPAQIAIAQPASQLLSGATQQLVQQSATQLVQQSAPQLAQQLAQQSGQVVERVAVHLAAQQSAQQQLVHQTTAQQLVCSTSQALALSNAQAQPIISYPIMTQSILPH